MPTRRRQAIVVSDDDSDGEYDHPGNRRPIVIKHGISPKIPIPSKEMKKHLARQSDLIVSLEKSDVRNSKEVEGLR